MCHTNFGHHHSVNLPEGGCIHNLKSWLQRTYACSQFWQDTQERTRKRIKEDLKDSGAAYNDYAEVMLPKLKSRYTKKYSDVEVHCVTCSSPITYWNLCRSKSVQQHRCLLYPPFPPHHWIWTNIRTTPSQTLLFPHAQLLLPHNHCELWTGARRVVFRQDAIDPHLHPQRFRISLTKVFYL